MDLMSITEFGIGFPDVNVLFGGLATVVAIPPDTDIIGDEEQFTPTVEDLQFVIFHAFEQRKEVVVIETARVVHPIGGSSRYLV